jgi:hypothetical protein
VIDWWYNMFLFGEKVRRRRLMQLYRVRSWHVQ